MSFHKVNFLSIDMTKTGIEMKESFFQGYLGMTIGILL